ncbi:pre-mRNA-processing protein 40B [Striga asiatica]|uniref:Pre-mRNA-processing protein 40B n=1 Tax=Striga asiatica TaxID=4170 RepID=A0A5A7PSN8_STRAF|nr:pre-mRNA-processing protein 40B [Striga asiatica]
MDTHVHDLGASPYSSVDLSTSTHSSPPHASTRRRFSRPDRPALTRTAHLDHHAASGRSLAADRVAVAPGRDGYHAGRPVSLLHEPGHVAGGGRAENRHRRGRPRAAEVAGGGGRVGRVQAEPAVHLEVEELGGAEGQPDGGDQAADGERQEKYFGGHDDGWLIFAV